MVFRKYIKRYFKYAGPNFSKKAFNARYNLASKALNTALSIKKLVNVEYKYTDRSFNHTPGNTGLVSMITNIAQGSDATERNGISILGKSIYIRGEAVINPASTTGSKARIIVFIDKNNQGAMPTVAEVLETVNINSALNMANGKRFWVLCDKQMDLNPAGNNQHSYMKYKKLNIHLRYSGTGSAVTNLRDNNIFFLTISDQAAGNSPTISCYSRFKYIDN